MNIFVKFQAYIRYKKAVAVATEKYLETGKRYFVMPTFGRGRQLVIIDRENFRLFKKRHLISKDARVQHLIEECFYRTPYFNGKDALTKAEIAHKKRMLYIWADAEHRRAKAVKRAKRQSANK